MAEKEGFEPSIRFRIHTFQACAFDRSAISPVEHFSRALSTKCVFYAIFIFISGRELNIKMYGGGWDGMFDVLSAPETDADLLA